MDILDPVSAALVAFVGALLTQICLRWDQTRRDDRWRLLDAIGAEQRQCEIIAYKAGQLIPERSETEEENLSPADIEDQLFGDLYRESKLVTLCAELKSYGIDSDSYSRDVHRFVETY